jgi:hypothetical protein
MQSVPITTDRLWVLISIRARCTTLCDKVCQWLATGRYVSLIRLSNYNCNEFIFPILNFPSFKFVSWLILCWWKLSIDCKYRSNTNLWISVSLTAFRDWKITTCHVSLMWSYGSCIYNYLCNWCPSPLMLWVRFPSRARCTALCDTVCQWLVAGGWFSQSMSIPATLCDKVCQWQAADRLDFSGYSGFSYQ